MSNNSKGTDRKSYTIYRDVVFVNVVIFPCLNTLFQKKKKTTSVCLVHHRATELVGHQSVGSKTRNKRKKNEGMG